MTHRPTRKYKVLKAKLEEKQSRSRISGKKTKRMKKWLAEYEELVEDRADKSDESANGDE